MRLKKSSKKKEVNKLRNKQIILNKKAVSPLIATVLLMAFAVALGAIVMTWGKNYVTQTTNLDEPNKQIACSYQVRGELITPPGKNAVCAPTTNKLTFIFRNGPSMDVQKLKVTAINDQNMVFNGNQTILIGKADIKNVDIQFSSDTNFGNLRQVIINPVIEYNGQEVICTDAVN